MCVPTLHACVSIQKICRQQTVGRGWTFGCIAQQVLRHRSIERDIEFREDVVRAHSCALHVIRLQLRLQLLEDLRVIAIVLHAHDAHDPLAVLCRGGEDGGIRAPDVEHGLRLGLVQSLQEAFGGCSARWEGSSVTTKESGEH